MKPYQGFFEDDHQEIIPIENKIRKLLANIRYAQTTGNYKSFDKTNYPLLITLISNIKLPSELDDDQASIAGAELTKGVHTFLKRQGATQLRDIPQSREVNLFESESWTRGLAETFFPEKLEKVKTMLPGILTQIYMILPPNGPELSEKIYDIAEGIFVLNAQKTPTEEIAKHLFVK